MAKERFSFWVKYLKAISIFFALMSTMWAILGSFDPLGIYDQAFAENYWNTNILPADAALTKKVLLAPLGATSAGFFILQWFIAKYAYAEKQLWGFNAIVSAFLLWFFLDTVMCLFNGAYFNIIIANIPALLTMIPIFFTRKYFN